MISQRVVQRMIDNLKDQEKISGIDPFGLAPDYLQLMAPVLQFFYNYYHRCSVYGASHIPRNQSALFVANHSGQIPMDALMIITAVAANTSPIQLIRPLVDKWVPTLPFASEFAMKCGGVVGTPENFLELKKRHQGLLVFPEGVEGICRPFSERYQLRPFGNGFLRLALETQTPIIPVALVGAEEQNFCLFNFKTLAKLCKVPAFPITPLFPLMGPLGLFPLPTHYHIFFGPPLEFHEKDFPTNGEEEISQAVKVVQDSVQNLLHKGLRRRKWIFF